VAFRRVQHLRHGVNLSEWFSQAAPDGTASPHGRRGHRGRQRGSGRPVRGWRPRGVEHRLCGRLHGRGGHAAGGEQPPGLVRGTQSGNALITATVAGGIGRPYATFGGAIIVGLVIQIAGTYTSSAYELVFAFLLLVVLMLFRPNGVFVRRSTVAVRA